MIADALQAEMIAQAARARRENPLLVAAADGTLTAEQVTHYLVNVRRILENTPTFLAKAHARALAVGDLALAAHFLHKAEEEEGHAEWAENDVVSMMDRVSVAREDIVPAAQELMDLTLSVVDEDPGLLLAYMFFNESLIVLVGDDALSNLESRCGVPRSSMTAIDHHITLDRDHVDEALATIDNLVPDPRKLPRMREIVRECFAIFDRFGAQITEEGHVRRHEHAVHAPAA